MQLSPLEMAFFNHLDAQLEKVESFYLTREREAEEKGKLLQDQIQELMEHKKVFMVRKFWRCKNGYSSDP